MMHTPSLGATVSANAKSPLFARLASEYLAEGKVQEAIAMSAGGLKWFPHYPTGNLVLGKCYAALGRHTEAVVQFRKVLEALPDSGTVTGLLNASLREEKNTFEMFAAERSLALAGKKDALTIDEFLARGMRPKETPAGGTVTELKPVRTPNARAEGEHDEEREETAAGLGGTIVTATLAEIYASQSQYREALEAYRKVAAQKPSEAARFEQRIAELEKLVRQQQTEQKP